MQFLFANPLSLIRDAVVFLFIISVLVAAHELGHYLFARLFGMGVEEFAIGFGKNPVVTWMRKFYTVPVAAGQSTGVEVETSAAGAASMSAVLEGRSSGDRIRLVEGSNGQMLQERTDFTIRPYPLGGFVRIKGMLPSEDGSETKIAGGFYSKPPWQRIIVLFAGPLFSVLAGILLLVGVYTTVGTERSSKEPVIARMVVDGPGAKGGLKLKDRILSVDGKPINTFFDVVREVRTKGGKQMEFVVERGTEKLTLAVTPTLDKEPTPVLDANFEPTDEKAIQGKIGIVPEFEVVRLSAPEALSEAAQWPVKAIRGIVGLFLQPSTFKDNVGGPGTMIAVTHRALELGPSKVIEVAALLSISVGIFNLLPSPPLDGGQMAIAFAEMLRGGRRLSFQVQTAVGAAGFLFIAVLIGSVLIVDVQRFGGGLFNAQQKR